MQNPGGGTVTGTLPLLPHRLQVTYTDAPTHVLIQQTPQIAASSMQTTVLNVTPQIEEAHSTTETSVSNLQTVQGGTEAGTTGGEPEKRNIYRHPLFPLMALLFEKCEQATQTSECPSSDSFDVDIQAFVHHQEQDQKPFFSEDPDLDALMVKAIQVLRIHLLELEKVSELCKDFCARYISCLKGKLQSENLLRIDGIDDGSPTSLDIGQGQSSGQVMTSAVSGSGLLTAQPAVSTLGQGQIVSGGTVYQMVQTPQGLVAQPIQIQSPPASAQPVTTATVIHGSTPLSQIGVCTTPLNSQVTSPLVASPSSDEDDDYGRGRKNKRGILPKQATQVMKSWLFQHIVHPYPTEDEKRTMSAQTNLSLLQVNNWFINARRRILQPMLDASNPEGSKTKKNKPQNRQVQRHWPDNIATLQVAQTSSSQTETDSSMQTLDAADSSEDTGGQQAVLVIQDGNQPNLNYLPEDSATSPQMALLAHAQQQGLVAMATMQSQNGGSIDMDDTTETLQTSGSSEISEATD